MNWHVYWQSILDWLQLSGLKLVFLIIGTFIALMVARIVANRLVSFYKKRHTDLELHKRADTLGSMFRYVLSTGVLIVSIMLILQLFGIELGPLLAAAGVAGIAIGFGAQHLVQDIFNGFFIMLDDEIREGDVVSAGGASGMVEQINLRQTVLRGLDGNVYFIPNGKIDVVTNMTKNYSYCLLKIGVAYREDVDEVFEVIEKVYEDLKDTSPFDEMILEPIEILGLDEFGDSAMIIQARIKVKPIKQWKVKREYNRLLKRAFDERNIEIPFPHLTVYAGQDKDGSAPPLNIRNKQTE